jgi:hypothetical protein
MQADWFEVRPVHQTFESLKNLDPYPLLYQYRRYIVITMLCNCPKFSIVDDVIVVISFDGN